MLRSALDGTLRGQLIGIETQLHRIDATGGLARMARTLVHVDRIDAIAWACITLLSVISVACGAAHSAFSGAWLFIGGPCLAFLVVRLSPRIPGFFVERLGPFGAVPGAMVVISIRFFAYFAVIEPVLLVAPSAAYYAGYYTTKIHLIAGVLAGVLVIVVLLFLLCAPYVRPAAWLVAAFARLRRRMLGTLIAITMVCGTGPWIWFLGLDAYGYEPDLPTNSEPAVIVVNVIVAMLMFFVLVRFLCEKLTGWRLRRRGTIQAEQALAGAARFYSPGDRVRYLRWLREERRFQPASGDERLLRDAIQAIERDGQIPLMPGLPWRWQKPQVPDPAAWSHQFLKWYKDHYTRHRGGMGSWSDSSLDELIRMAADCEQEPAQRRGKTR